MHQEVRLITGSCGIFHPMKPLLKEQIPESVEPMVLVKQVMVVHVHLQVCIAIFFTVYALDDELDLSAGATKQELLDAMSGHVITSTELMGVYQKHKQAVTG